jgi:hypothetical protein
MALDVQVANDTWNRYTYLRDNGHLDYVQKAAKCDDFFVGLQWDRATLAMLRMQRRPALTINKIIATMSNVMGEQIFNRSEIAFRPARRGATGDVADALTRVYRHISDDNQLDWIRSDVFADGIIGSRGFFDARLNFDENVAGEVAVTQLNPKNVLIDADAEEYDPDTWGDVIVSKWLSPDMIAMTYNEEIADALRGADSTYWPYSYDSIDRDRDRFGDARTDTFSPSYGNSAGLVRNVRVLERQWRKLDRMNFFIDPKTGDRTSVPSEWDRDRIALQVQRTGVVVQKQLAPRIRWTVVADRYVLHDEWSPYRHFTVVPFFPHFRRGRTVGLVENLLGPQELLNKVRSQELHIVNTTANSGWKIKRGALQNMSVTELEQKGSMTGLVMELDEIENAEKISPNTVPTGLERISFKSEDDIKNISGVSDYQTGNPREDVAAKAVRANQAAGQANNAKVMDNLRRTDYILARNILHMVQPYYTEYRLLNITTDMLTGATEPLEINSPTPEGTIVNDLTLGEYGITVTSEPQRDTFEDSQFEQALRMKTEAGVQIPDSFLIKNSRLRDKAEIVKEIESAANSPEAQEAKALQKRKALADVSQVEATANLQNAKAQAETQGQGMGELMLEKQKMEMEHALEVEKMERKHALESEKLAQEMDLKRQEHQMEMQFRQQEAEDDRLLKRAQAAAAMQQSRAQAQATKQKGNAQAAAASAPAPAPAAKPAEAANGGTIQRLEIALPPVAKRKTRITKDDKGGMLFEEID